MEMLRQAAEVVTGRPAPRRLLVLVMVIGLSLGQLTACSKKVEFDEEVLLSTGKKITVHRVVQFERRGEFGGGFKDVEVASHITIPHPSGARRSIQWESGLLPIRLDLIAGSLDPVLVALPLTCEDYDRFGRPKPGYIEFRFVGNQWRSYPVTPAMLELPANLLIETREIGARGTVDLGTKDEANAKLLAVKLRRIDHTFQPMCGK